MPATDSTPAYQRFTIVSAAIGEPRPINVYRPASYRAGGPALPVLYMPDGGLDEDFPHVVRAVDSLVALGRIRPVMVVGIPNTQRRRDLTGPTRIKDDSAVAPRVGGSAAFRRFLGDELVPAIRARYRVTEERTIIGESFAGLFVVETLLESPALFTHYIALDPSFWWNAGALVEGAGARVGGLGGAERSLYLATSLETGTSRPAATLDSLLRARPPRGFRWTYVPRPDLTHGNIFRNLEGEALVHALR